MKNGDIEDAAGMPERLPTSPHDGTTAHLGDKKSDSPSVIPSSGKGILSPEENIRSGSHRLNRMMSLSGTDFPLSRGKFCHPLLSVYKFCWIKVNKIT